MAEKKKPRHERMYSKKPHLERDEEGNMAVQENDKRGEKPTETMEKADKIQSGDDGVKMTEGLPPHVRHAHERRDMHARHEVEHSVHDHAKAGSKKEMHTRHEKAMKDMHSRHEKEIDAVESKDQDIKEGHETAKDKGE